MIEYQIQVKNPDWDISGGWWNLSGVCGFMFHTMFSEEEARETLKRIETEFAPKTGKQYRIVKRQVTEWEVL